MIKRLFKPKPSKAKRERQAAAKAMVVAPTTAAPETSSLQTDESLPPKELLELLTPTPQAPKPPEPPLSDQSCANCLYARKFAGVATVSGRPGVAPDGSSFLQCHHNPPPWERIEPFNWCGQWSVSSTPSKQTVSSRLRRNLNASRQLRDHAARVDNPALHFPHQPLP